MQSRECIANDKREEIPIEPAMVYTKSVKVHLKTGPDIIDITNALDQEVKTSNIQNGLMSACMTGSTGSLTTIEYEPGVVEDLKQAIDRLAPPGLDYAHERAWHDGNGHSHVQAAVMGPSIAVPVRSGHLKLGAWQQVVAINHDNRPRERTVEVTIVGMRDVGFRDLGVEGLRD